LSSPEERKVLRELPAKAALLKTFITQNSKSGLKVSSDKLNIGQNVFSDWISRKSRSGTDSTFERIVNGIKSIDSSSCLSTEDFSDKCDKYNFGRKLGYTWQEVEKLYDYEMLTHIFPGRDYLQKEKVSDQIAKYYKGTYTVIYWKKDINSNNRLAKSKLRIRYSLRLQNEAWLVRCKLHMFYEKDDNNYVPYDGSVIYCGNFLHFHFMSVSINHPDSRDRVTIICKDNPGAEQIRGILTSTNIHDDIYSSPVVLVRTDNKDLDKLKDRSPLMQEMREGIGYISKDKIENAPSFVSKQRPLVLDTKDSPVTYLDI